MKKTLQSKLTAALFAAALSTSGGTLSPQLANAVNDITPVPQTTYGPPAMTTADTTTETTSELLFSTEAPTVTMTTSTTQELVYGTEAPTAIMTTTTEEPVQIKGEVTIPSIVTTTTTTEDLVTGGVVPIYVEPGDVDMNGSIDARDLTLLKRYLLTQNKARNLAGSDTYDVNQDGSLNKEDVQALVRLLTGKPEDEEDPVVTAPTAVNGTETSTTTFTEEPICLYGPPNAWK